MKSQKKIFAAFLLNLLFSVFEIVGGMLTGSVAILSDAVHDFGDAVSIGASYFLERKSKRKPDATHTYGYARYSVIGSVITTLTLLFGSAVAVYHAVHRLINPTPIDYNGMILFASVGVMVNLVAVLITIRGETLNQRAVSLHMMEDVLTWLAVLLGSLVMWFTDLKRLDPILSIGVAVFVCIHAIRHLKAALDVFLEKTPRGLDVQELKNDLMTIEGVQDVHHIHLWSMDGQSNYATMHVVANADPHTVKEAIREKLKVCGIGHVTLELESAEESCGARECCVEQNPEHDHGHHHHH